MTMLPYYSPLVASILENGPGGEATAVQDRDTVATYSELRRDVSALVDTLRSAGVRAGDRIALVLPKSVCVVKLILSILATGAVYVPLNHRLPPRELRRIIDNLEPVLLVAEPSHGTRFLADLGHHGVFGISVLAGSQLEFLSPIPSYVERLNSPEHLAAILYTSGSTGEPKGIMLTHGNIVSFVDWAAKTFEISAKDKLANHAPFHFDLSIFDLFCALTRHASVHLLDETASRFPGQVRTFIDSAAITVWYSVPTALTRLQGRNALAGVASLRLVLFAGEVFPVPVLRRLMSELRQPEYVNLYGPTETNVCTYHRLSAPPASDLDTLPIGRPCEHLKVTLCDTEGAAVTAGETGEICVEGPAVMHGYWRRQEMTAATRLTGRRSSYCTGDYGWCRADGAIMFAGRRDEQVKIRGHRVELLALEAVLNAHPELREAAALVVPDDSGGVLVAFLVAERGPVPVAELRRFVADRLAPYYQPDRLEWIPELPRTVTGKCDRTALRSIIAPL